MYLNSFDSGGHIAKYIVCATHYDETINSRYIQGDGPSSHPGRIVIFLAASCYRNQVKFRPCEPPWPVCYITPTPPPPFLPPLSSLPLPLYFMNCYLRCLWKQMELPVTVLINICYYCRQVLILLTQLEGTDGFAVSHKLSFRVLSDNGFGAYGAHHTPQLAPELFGLHCARPL